MVRENSATGRLATSLLLCCVLFSAVSAEEPDWYLKLKRLRVFQSTRQDVESIFGSPEVIYSTKNDSREKGWGEVTDYQTKDGKLELFYSTGRCSEATGTKGWDIAEDVIVSIEFKPSEPVRLSRFDLDLTSFEREKAIDNENWTYRSENLGIELGVLDDKVTSFEYTLTPQMRELDCENILGKKSDK